MRGLPRISITRACPLWRALFMACYVAASGCGGGPSDEVEGLWKQAETTLNQAVQDSDFLRAAALYQQILDRGFVHGDLFFQQGNAYTHAGRKGRAIAAYRQAERYLPRDPYLAANLDLLSGEALARQVWPLWETVIPWQNWLAYHEKFHLAFGLAALACLAAVVATVWPRRGLRWVARASLAVLLLLSVSIGYDVYRYEYRVSGVIVDSQVEARKGNAESFAPAFTRPLPEGTEFMLLEKRNSWLFAEFPGGQQGWLPEEAVVLF